MRAVRLLASTATTTMPSCQHNESGTRWSDPPVIGGRDPYVLVLIQLLDSVRLPLRSRSHAGRLGPQPASKSTADSLRSCPCGDAAPGFLISWLCRRAPGGGVRVCPVRRVRRRMSCPASRSPPAPPPRSPGRRPGRPEWVRGSVRAGRPRAVTPIIPNVTFSPTLGIFCLKLADSSGLQTEVMAMTQLLSRAARQ